MSDSEKKQCSKALLLFIKNPIKGRVKTRLAASVGDDKALEIYKELLAHTQEVSIGLKDTHRILFYDKAIEPNDDWSKDLFNKQIQPEGDLGAKMEHAFNYAFDQAFEKVVIVGSDCAQISVSDIENAYDALDHVDVVYGPAMDGGYYLCGLRLMNNVVFKLKAWSTNTVLEESIALCSAAGLSVSLLRTLSDIDNIEDWQRYGFSS